MCVNLVLLRKFCKKSRYSQGKITQFAQILHDRRLRRSRQISTPFELDTLLRGVNFREVVQKSLRSSSLCQQVDALASFCDTFLAFLSHLYSLQRRPTLARGAS